MRNRTHLIGIAIASCSLLMSACQQEAMTTPTSPDLSGEAIIFTSPYTVGRASNVNTDWAPGTKVGVLGYCHAIQAGVDLGPADWNTKKDFVHADVMWNQQLSFNEGIWDYDYNGQGLREWYEEPNPDQPYKYTFFAYHPYVNATGTGEYREGEVEGGKGKIRISGPEQTNDPIITYTMPYTGNSTANNLPLDKVPDLMLTYTTDHKRTDGTVSLNFRHMFCGLVFEVNNYTNQEVQINKLTFEGSNFYQVLQVVGQQNGYSIGDTDASGKPTSLYGGQFSLITQPVTIDPATVDETTGKVTPGHQRVDTTLLFITDENGKITYTGPNHTEGGCAIVINNQSHMEIEKGMSFTAGVKSIFSINYIGNDFTIQIRNSDNWEDGGDSDITFE